jgi:hypothetical protein
VSQCVSCAAGSAPVGPAGSVPVADVRGDLLELFAGVPDGRAGQGRDHPVAAVLALAAAAVVAGMRGYTAITGWVAEVPPAILAGLYLRSGAAPAPPPSKTTIRRVLTDADTEALDVAAGTWLMNPAGFSTPATARRDAGEEDCPPALMQVRLDGKAVRGAKDADGNQVRLLAALAGPDAAGSVIAAQAEVGKKTNEVPMAAVVLGRIDLEGKIVTADALHREGHREPHPRRRARRRQPRARAGRRRGPGPVRPGAVVDRVSALDVRDTLYQEDKSQVRTRSGPRAMAALRNLAIGAIRMAGRIDVTEATRWASRSMDRPFTILGLTS